MSFSVQIDGARKEVKTVTDYLGIKEIYISVT